MRQDISQQQLWQLLMGFLIGTAAILTPGAAAGREAWLAVLISIGPAVALALLYAWFVARFRGQTLVGVLRTVYGTVFGSLLAGLYLLYILHLGSLVVTNFGDFLTTFVFTATPEWFLLVLFVSVAGYAAWSGIEVLSRVATLLVLPILAAYLFDGILLTGPFRLERLMPFFSTPWPKLLWATWAAVAFPLAEIVAFLMLIPSIKDEQRSPRQFGTAVVAAGLLFVAVTFRNAGAFGENIKTYVYPSFQALRLVNIGDFLTRFEVGVAIVFIATGFVKLSILYYGAAIGFSELFGLTDYRSLIVPFGSLLVWMGLQNFRNSIANAEFASYTYPIYASVFQIVIPLLTALIARLRHLPLVPPQPTTPAGAAGQDADAVGRNKTPRG